MNEKKETYKVRCGLCNVEIKEATFEEHKKSELHQSNLPKPREPVRMPVVPVREVSEAERKENKRQQNYSKAENLGYYSVANGRSYYHCRCECGELVDVFCWRGEKRCPNCWKVIAIPYSFHIKYIQRKRSDE